MEKPVFPYSERLNSIDLAKTFAVLLMIFGHTISEFTISSDSFFNSKIGTFWYFFRGITAPLFLLSSGILYSYNYHKTTLFIKLKKVILITILAFAMHVPIFNGSWEEFYRIDILHLFALLFLLSSFILKPLQSNNYTYIKREAIKVILLVLIIAIGIGEQSFFNYHPETIHPLIINFINPNENSLFPIFPFAIYFLTGLIGGILIRQKNDGFKNIVASFIFLVIGINYFDETPPYIFILTVIIAIVLLLSGFTRLVKKSKRYIKFISNNSLWFYISHLLLIYGHNSLIGVGSFISSKSLSIYESLVLSSFIIITCYFIIMKITRLISKRS
ncbi:heparan-alpha-glucosaminide N-acetyltransferase domain-containing protein [Candidatus Kapabacteria bacterium]|nr:heparan-alpha-glucosaminide N-acetyltransferase domain-containing protein [Candidatus Kapabacteria bacterium]